MASFIISFLSNCTKTIQEYVLWLDIPMSHAPQMQVFLWNDVCHNHTFLSLFENVPLHLVTARRSDVQVLVPFHGQALFQTKQQSLCTSVQWNGCMCAQQKD